MILYTRPTRPKHLPGLKQSARFARSQSRRKIPSVVSSSMDRGMNGIARHVGFTISYEIFNNNWTISCPYQRMKNNFVSLSLSVLIDCQLFQAPFFRCGDAPKYAVNKQGFRVSCSLYFIHILTYYTLRYVYNKRSLILFCAHGR